MDNEKVFISQTIRFLIEQQDGHQKVLNLLREGGLEVSELGDNGHKIILVEDPEKEEIKP